MATKIDGSDFDISIGGTDICADSTSFNHTRDVSEVTTNCDTDKVYIAHNQGYDADASGPLEFGTGSTEATIYSDINGGASQTWLFDPDGTGTATATNPIRSVSAFCTSFSISASVGSAITYSGAWQGTGSLTRSTS